MANTVAEIVIKRLINCVSAVEPPKNVTAETQRPRRIRRLRQHEAQM